jgi:ADP-ribose pyrophosphatase YjhB (NUDIX family)
MSTNDDLHLIADELQAIANLGSCFSKNEHDLDRYKKIRSISARILGVIENRSPNEILEQLQNNLLHVSPILGSEAALFQNDQILLIKRHDDGLWAIPGGLVDVGESWAKAAERELWEETRVRGRATKLMGVFDSRNWKSKSNLHLYHAIFLVESENPSPSVTSEATEVGFFSEDNLPPLSRGHHLRVPFVFRLYRGEEEMAFFDLSEPSS